MRKPRSRALLLAKRFFQGVWPALLIWIVLFTTRLLLAKGRYSITPEECHTGGVASEIIANGFRFPLLAYSPEVYENGIIVNGILAIPFFALFGHNVLSLKILATTIATLTTIAGLCLLNRVVTHLDRPQTERVVASGLYVALLAFSPFMFTYKSLDSLGDENEGVLATMYLLLLFVRRIEVPSRVRQVTLWMALGLAASWHVGTLLVTALVVVHELWSVRNGLSQVRDLRLAFYSFMTGHLPGLAAAWANGFAQYSMIFDKFNHPGTSRATLLKFWANALWSYVLPTPVWLLLLIGGFAWLLIQAIRLRPPHALAYFGLYVIGHQFMMLNASGHSDYFVYAHYLQVIPVAVWAARFLLDPPFTKMPRSMAATGIFVLFTAIIAPNLEPDFGKIASLRADTGRASCFWRFGRAFLNRSQHEIDGAMKLCRLLGGDAALECISGVAFDQAQSFSATVGQSSVERRAFAYGTGQGFVRIHGGDVSGCDTLETPPEREACFSGAVAQCAMYADLRSFGGLHAPSCKTVPPPFNGIAKSWMDMLSERPKSVSTPSMFPDPRDVCGQILERCFSIPSNRLSTNTN